MRKSQPPSVGYVPEKAAKILRHQRPLAMGRSEMRRALHNWNTMETAKQVIAAAIAVGIRITYPDGKGPAR
jgi:hypothetical protein